jgi:Ca2+-binding RTX toxin-like protein
MIDVYVTPVEACDAAPVKGSARGERFIVAPGEGCVSIDAQGGGDIVRDAPHLTGSFNLRMGDGDDFVSGLSAEYSFDADLGPGNDRLSASEGEDGCTVYGGPGNDAIDCAGGAFGALIDGGPGNDVLSGSGATEGITIKGGEGDDAISYRGGYPDSGGADLYGGPGADRITCGGFPDLVHFTPANTPRGSGRDRVLGFADGADRLLIDGDADRTRSGTQAYRFVGRGTRPGAGQIMWYPVRGSQVVIGSDGRTVFEIKLEGFRGTLDASDFRPR